MNGKYFLATWTAIALAVPSAFAQNTSVQLPVFSFNTVNTTVTAPDGGTIQLGGVNRASSGRTERSVPILGKLPFANRLFKNVGIGQDYSSGMTTVTPRIIILEEEEAKLGLQDFSSGAPVGGALSGSVRRSYGQATRELTETDMRALRLSRHVSDNVALQSPREQPQQPSGPSAAEIQERNAQAALTRTSESYKFFEKGQAAEEAGKANVAKIYYNMAARRADDDLKSAIQLRLDAIAEQ